MLNFIPGLAGGFLLGWKGLPSVLLGGVTYVSSSGIVAKMFAELGRLNNRETPLVLSILVIEDLAMAIYLPVVSVLLLGGGSGKIAASVAIAVVAVSVVLVIAIRHGQWIGRYVAHESEEIVLLTTFGAVLLVAGAAQHLQVSAAIGAFLVGIAVSGPIAEQSRRLLAPLRDLFAAGFFFFFGLQIAPGSLLPALAVASGLAVITAATKIAAGYLGGRGSGFDNRESLRARMALVPRGEFSIVIAGLGVAIDPRLGPLSACYVLLLAVLDPLLVRLVK